jgi:hypothetical protein
MLDLIRSESDAPCCRFENEPKGIQIYSERRAVRVCLLVSSCFRDVRLETSCHFHFLYFLYFPLLLPAASGCYPDTLQYSTASDLRFSPPRSQAGWATQLAAALLADFPVSAGAGSAGYRSHRLAATVITLIRISAEVKRNVAFFASPDYGVFFCCFCCFLFASWSCLATCCL